MKSNVDLLHGNIMKSLMIFAIPMLISSIFQQMYNTVDTILVGNILGETSLAAIGAGSPINELILGFALGIGSGLSIVTARSYGSGDVELMKKSVANVILIGTGVSVIVTVIALLGVHPLLVLLRTPEAILDEAKAYISLIAAFLWVSMLYNLCSGLLRAVGNSLMPLIFLIISSIINIFLDYYFITETGLGIRGAAVATVISQFISSICSIIYLVKKCPMLVPKKEHFRFDKALFEEMIGQGISMGLMRSIVSSGSVVLQYGINGLGYLTIAAHTTARKIYMFGNMPFISMGSAISTFVSQNKGADQPQRIRKAMKCAAWYSVVVDLVIVVCFGLFAQKMVAVVSGSSEQVLLDNATMYLWVVAPFFTVLGCLNCLRHALSGLGMKKLPLVSSVIEFIGKVIFVAVLIPVFGYKAVIFCEPVIWCVMVVQLAISFYGNPYIKSAKK
ncbi:MAG: MATE family efflux transporter [Ruminococcus sp.]|nr:MATE family efflux transporter [Ruminococcus sp.]